MNIHNQGTLIKFWKKHADSKKVLELWYNDVCSKKWKKPNEVTLDFASADILTNDRVVFNIKGNKYRLVASINYHKGWLFIKFIGTHVEYNKIDATTIEVY
ncbi:MAG: type II toxin-antitoxin system HigB family toxin [Bacteroidetes bacterium]|nr:type II toxin-antitoxin system HigB family toxin [Bacteroidota bacterium]MBK9411929.1 type II toxin-antitoxin system HigB family toxin [Bacteroidota bacterium]